MKMQIMINLVESESRCCYGTEIPACCELKTQERCPENCCSKEDCCKDKDRSDCCA